MKDMVTFWPFLGHDLRSRLITAYSACLCHVYAAFLMALFFALANRELCQYFRLAVCYFPLLFFFFCHGHIDPHKRTKKYGPGGQRSGGLGLWACLPRKRKLNVTQRPKTDGKLIHSACSTCLMRFKCAI